MVEAGGEVVEGLVNGATLTLTPLRRVVVMQEEATGVEEVPVTTIGKTSEISTSWTYGSSSPCQSVGGGYLLDAPITTLSGAHHRIRTCTPVPRHWPLKPACLPFHQMSLVPPVRFELTLSGA